MKANLEINFAFWAKPSEKNLAIAVKKEKSCVEKKKTKTKVALKNKQTSPAKVKVHKANNCSDTQNILIPQKEIKIKQEPITLDFNTKKAHNKSSKVLDKILLKINSMNSLKRQATDETSNADVKKRKLTDEIPKSNKSDEIKPPTPKICLKMRRTTADHDELNSSHDSYVIVQPPVTSSVEKNESSSNSGGSRLDNLDFIKSKNIKSSDSLTSGESKDIFQNKSQNAEAGRKSFEKKTSRRKMKRPEKVDFVEEGQPKEGDQLKDEVKPLLPPQRPPVKTPSAEDALFRANQIQQSAIPFNALSFKQTCFFKAAASFKATSSFESSPPPYFGPQNFNKNKVLFAKQAHEINQSRQHVPKTVSQGSKAVLMAEKFNHSVDYGLRTPPSGERFCYKNHVASVERSPEHQKLHANALSMARKLFKDIKPHSDRLEDQGKWKPRPLLPKATMDNAPQQKIKSYQPSRVVINSNNSNFDVINAHLQKHKAVLSTQKSGRQSNLNNSNSTLSQNAIHNFSLKSMLQKPMNSTKTIHPASNSSIEVRYQNTAPAQQLNGNNVQFTFQQNNLNQPQQNLRNLNQSASTSNLTNVYQIQKSLSVAQNSQSVRQAASTSTNVRNIAKKYVNIGSNNSFIANNQRAQTYNISTIDLNLLQKQLSGNKTFVTTVGDQGKLLGNSQTLGTVNLVQIKQPVQVQGVKKNISYQGDQSTGKSVRWTQNTPKTAVVQAPPPIIRFTDPKNNNLVVPMTTNVQTFALKNKPSSSSTGRVYTQDTPIDFSKNKES